MASVVQQSKLTSRINHSLDYLMREWMGIPEVASTWDDWDEADRLDFVLEWQLRIDRLSRVQQWHVEGRLSPVQRERLAALQQLIDRHQETVDRLLAE